METKIISIIKTLSRDTQTSLQAGINFPRLSLKLFTLTVSTSQINLMVKKIKRVL